MKQYDEYQKYYNYKYGSHSFNILMLSILINSSLATFEIQWAETRELEYALLVFPALYYSLLMNIYKGSYYKKNSLSALNSFFLGLWGVIFSLWIIFMGPDILSSSGQVTSGIVPLLLGLMWVCGATVHAIASLIENKKD
ncbi:hypothetical protein GCM10008929_20490 [Alkalibacterium psychrotolerans]